MRRALLGLAALALEGLEQDGLLAEHVGALDGPDLDREVVAGAEDVRPMKPASVGGPDGRRRADAMTSLSSARTAMNASLRADGVGRDGEALDHRVRVELHQRAVRVRRGVGAVAVRDGIAARRVDGRRGPPLVTGREAGPAAAAQPARGDRRRSTAVRRRGRGSPGAGLEGARLIAASRSVGSLAAARASRIDGQPAGVVRRSVMARLAPGRRAPMPLPAARPSAASRAAR